MPFDVAVEEPNTRVVRLEAQHNVAERVQDEGIAAHGSRAIDGLRGVRDVKEAGIIIGAGDGLEVVAVEVKGVFARI